MKTQFLKSIFLLCILDAVFCILADAQIVYTNINPDSTCNTNGCTYNLDLNNDGINDFTLKYDTDFEACGGMCHDKIPTRKVSIKPYSENGVVVDGGDNLPSAMDENNSINASLIFNTANNGVLASIDPHCEGSQIRFCIGEPIGHWSDVTPNKYLGLRVSFGGDNYYGWARLDVSAYFTIKDYAFNSTPDQSILAGDTGGVATNIHNIKGFSSIAVSPNAFQYLTHISFSLPRTEKVSVQIFDAQGRLIRTLADQVFSQGENQLQWNATDENGNAVSTGIYLLKIASQDFSQTEKLMVVK